MTLALVAVDQSGMRWKELHAKTGARSANPTSNEA